MKAIISVLLIAFTAHITAQSIEVNTTELCLSYRYLVSWDLGSLPEGRYTVDSPSILTAIAEYSISSAQAIGSRYNYLLQQPAVLYTVTLLDAQDRKWNSTSFARASGCTNLPTYGKTLGEQATLVLDHYRTQVKNSYRIYRHPKLERLAELLLSTGSRDIAYYLTLLSPVPDWYSYELIQTNTDADAGSIIQILLDTPASYLSGEKIPAPNTNIMREVGFAYNATQQTWLVVLTNRTSIKCGNGLLDASEGCDDGNRDDYDGCSSTCQIEAGWSCPDDVLQSGSICVTTPSYVPLAGNTPDQGSNPNSPSSSSTPSDSTPSGSNSPSGGNNPSNGSPSGPSNSPSTQQTSGSSKIELVAVMITFLLSLLY